MEPTEELLTCRTCLITDVKLYDMFKYNLADPYAVLTRTEELGHDLPQHMCGICASLLLKSVTFQTQCNTAQRVLKKALTQECELTMPLLRSIDRSAYSFAPALSFTPIEQINYIHEAKVDVKNYVDFQDKSEDTVDNVETLVQIKQDIDDETSNYDEVETKLENSDSDEDVCVLCEYFGVDKCDEMMEEFKNETANENSEEESSQKEDDIKIITLSREQQIEELQKIKESLQYLTAKYKCDKCYKSYNIEYMYRAHLVHHDPASGEHVCDICSRRYSERHAFNYHVRSHERRYECLQCHHVFVNLSVAKSHVSQSHKEVDFKCEPCGESFTTYSAYYTHTRTKHAEHRCELCGEAFPNIKGLRQHRIFAHIIKAEALKNCKDNVCASCNTKFESQEALDTHKDAGTCNTNMKPCVACGAGFETEEELKEHKIIHRKKATVKCQLCDKTFPDRYAYRAHYKEQHFEGSDVTDPLLKPKMDSVCELCGKIFRTAFGLRAHQARCGAGAGSASGPPKKRHICNQCGQAFATTTHLAVHIRTHTGERPFQCEYCSKAFYTRPSLVTHTRIHTGEKPYLCEHCGKSFTQSKTRKIHIMGVHMDVVGIQRHACTLCPSSFKLACYLKEHMKRHTGEKPYKGSRVPRRPNTGEKTYKCKICTKTFWTRGAMHTHNSLKHRGPFTCTECDMVFDRSSDRKIHILKDHRGKNVYSCTHCDQVFGYSWSRNDHVATQHLGTKPRGAKKRAPKQKPAETPDFETETDDAALALVNAKKRKFEAEPRPKKRRHGAEKQTRYYTQLEAPKDAEYAYEARGSEEYPEAGSSERGYAFEAEDRSYLVVRNEAD